MVIECHMLPPDSVILAWHELDECISHKSDGAALPGTAPSKMFMLGYSNRHCVIGRGPLSEIGLWKVSRPDANSSYYYKWTVITL